MKIIPAVLEKLETFRSFDEFVRHLLTGAGVRDAAKKDDRDFFYCYKDCKKLYDYFWVEIEARTDMDALRYDIYPDGAEDGTLDEPLEKQVKLLAVNEILHNHCRDIYEELAGKINSKNEMNAVVEIYSEIKRQQQQNPSRQRA